MAIMVVAGAGIALFMMNNNNSSSSDDAIITHRLLLMGNVYDDDTLDDNDVTVLKAYLDKKTTVTVKGNVIDLTDPKLIKYCDVDNSGSVDQKDVTALETIIEGKATKLYYENAKGEIAGVDVPMNNLLIMFRRTGTTVKMVGAEDMVKGFIKDLAPGGNYAFLGFTGENLGAGSEPDYEKIRAMNVEYKSTGGVTLLADATGSAADLEEKVGAGIDVVRLPVTEKGNSEKGVITLSYLLAYGNEKHDQIMERLNEWKDWSDSAKKKITDAVEKMSEADKEKIVVALWNASASSATVNIRTDSSAEYEYSVMSGGNNIGTKGSYSMNELNEYLLSEKPDIFFVMQQETFLTNKKISAQTTYDEFMAELTDSYKGKVGLFSQFLGSGPGYIISMMYYANAMVPGMDFDVQKEYEYFMGTLIGNEELAKVQISVDMA